MRLRGKIAAILMTAGSACALTAPAHAAGTFTPPGINGAVPVSSQLSEMVNNSVDPAAVTTTAYAATGICSGNGCWRNASNALDYWPRDISGDPNQQFLVTYWGQANQGADGGACSQFGNVGVYTFVSPADGNKFEGAGTLSGGVYYAGGQSGNNRYSNWVWQSNGVLLNCGDSQNGANFALITSGAFYHQMYTANTGFGNNWSQVHV